MPSESEGARLLTESAAVYRTSDRIVHVRGDDARSWLNGQISNDVRTLAGDASVYAVALTVKGRVVSDLWAVADGDGMALVLPSGSLESTLARLEQHIIMEDVELELDDTLAVVTVQGPSAAQVLEALPASVRRVRTQRFPQGGYDCWLPAEQLDHHLAELAAAAARLGGGVLDESSWARLHVELGVPRYGVDFGEQSYPQEAGLRQRALSFSKGCYLGQEVIYMLDQRGQVARRLVQLEASAATVDVGAAVHDAEGKRLGEVTSAVQDGAGGTRALAYVKRAQAEPGGTVWIASSPWRVTAVVGGA